MIFAQYETATGFVKATTTARVPDELLPPGIAQVEADSDAVAGKIYHPDTGAFTEE